MKILLSVFYVCRYCLGQLFRLLGKLLLIDLIYNLVASRAHLLDKTHQVDFMAGKKVLIVDDQEICCDLAAKLLEPFNAVITIAHNGQEAIKHLQHNPCDLVIMDLQMPNMGGIAATRAIRDRQYFAHNQCHNSRSIPIVAYTSLSEDEALNAIINSGMDALLQKPIEPDNLARVLHTVLKNNNLVISKYKHSVMLLDSRFLVPISSKCYLHYLGFALHKAVDASSMIDTLNNYKVDYIFVNPFTLGKYADEIAKILHKIHTDKQFSLNSTAVIIGVENDQNISQADIKKFNIQGKIANIYDRQALLNLVKKKESIPIDNVINLNVLNSLDELDKCFSLSLLKDFLNSSKSEMIQLQEYYDKKEIENFQSLTHAIKGNSASLGLYMLRDFITIANDAAKQGLLPDSEEWSKELAEIYNTTATAIEKHINQHT